ncbi:unnamed protein product [Rotaria sp. Silwood1]|nr:unnamed protein product [Rotaria sp. Silwood1]CAF1190228.1 unnamed protein product [Rotaria sp. Silwood1]CAF3436823.1 unnamed protein product [Rotaria sp. Silwood1]CAF3483763.1 unnamed protein product [Rotaria sp. Silwood1]CAF4767525.1 unnamed protein product [Rotaria sp. Silwood1]
MSILFSTTEKGKPVLIENGFDYIQERTHENKVYWRCTQCNKQKCKARLHTTNNTICHRIGDHNHAPNPSISGIRQCRSEIRDLSKTTMATHSIVATSIGTASTAVLSQLPPINNFKRTICRQRAANLNFPANPRSISEIHINGSFALTKKKEQFLQYDSGNQDSDRFLIFATNQQLDLLQSCTDVYMDGTFKVVPELFYQLYSIHGSVQRNIIPLAYILMPRKNEENYKRVYDAIISLRPLFNPSSFLIDFESGAMKAINSCWPQSSVHACFFHLTQNIYRQVQKAGFTTKYGNDEEYAHAVRMLPALAFLETNDIYSTFEDIGGLQIPDLDPVYNYFEDYYIGRFRSRNRRIIPTFPITFWNVHNLLRNQFDHTNNAVEGWHRRLNNIVDSAHPGFWRFLSDLQTEQSYVDGEISQLVTGLVPKPKRIKTQQTASRVLRILENPTNDNIQKIKAIAHTFML